MNPRAVDEEMKEISTNRAYDIATYLRTLVIPPALGGVASAENQNSAQNNLWTVVVGEGVAATIMFIALAHEAVKFFKNPQAAPPGHTVYLSLRLFTIALGVVGLALLAQQLSLNDLKSSKVVIGTAFTAFSFFGAKKITDNKTDEKLNTVLMRARAMPEPLRQSDNALEEIRVINRN